MVSTQYTVIIIITIVIITIIITIIISLYKIRQTSNQKPQICHKNSDIIPAPQA